MQFDEVEVVIGAGMEIARIAARLRNTSTNCFPILELKFFNFSKVFESFFFLNCISL